MAGASARILVVDDNRPLTRAVERLLSMGGYEVSLAFDGLQGYLAAQKERPDLIILDITMPGMDGYEVCRRLQASQETRDIPVLIFSAKGTMDERDHRSLLEVRLQERLEGYEAGALEFLTKPVAAEEMLERVRALLWLSSVTKSPESRPDPV